MCCLVIHRFHLRFPKIPSRRSANVCQSVPLIHAELSHTNLHIYSVIILNIDATLAKSFADHVLMCFLTSFDFGYKPSPSFRKVTHELFIPQMFLGIRTPRPFSRSNTDKYPYFPTRPLIDTRFIEDNWRRVILTRSLVNKYRLTDLYGFECKTSGTSCPSGLPNCAVGFWR